ncbi:uncharacterized protein LTR77_002854 [Saxophila tyrrhenica]|uniref:Uncharacterized protein n=1 Tax=Saxophila tyrrhenica TaxID=1690608 RepID=A0AAV9PG51_9PEZI|nr:hypothetical protein LTR77_002854 [Saxophila tyrrhenica]
MRSPGAARSVDVLFRDESENIIRKAKASEAKKTTASNRFSDRRKLPHDEPVQKVSEREPGLLDITAWQGLVDGGLTMRPTLEESATCHFFFNYIVGVNAPTRMEMDNLTWMYKHSNTDGTLTTAVRAVSFASYAHHRRSTELENASMLQYTKACGLTNEALQSSDRAVKDTTLLSILILGMYEVMTGVNQRSIKAWIAHVNGSAALLKLRGTEQLANPIGRRLFVQAMTGILTTSIQLCMPIPDNIMEMAEKLPDLIHPADDFARRAYNIHLALINANQYRCVVESKELTDPFDIVSKGLELDAPLAAVHDSSVPEWKYDVRTSSEHHIAFKGTYHVYADLLTANLWSATRVMRSLLHETIRSTLLQGFAARPPVFTKVEHTKQFQRTTDLLHQLAADILASVPQHLGYVKASPVAQTQETAQEEPSQRPQDSIKAFMPSNDIPFRDVIADMRHAVAPKSSMQFVQARSSGGMNLMWPLFYAATRDISTPEQQAYCTKVLRVIGDEMGIRQALVLAGALESKTGIDAWDGDENRVELEDD